MKSIYFIGRVVGWAVAAVICLSVTVLFMLLELLGLAPFMVYLLFVGAVAAFDAAAENNKKRRLGRNYEGPAAGWEDA